MLLWTMFTHWGKVESHGQALRSIAIETAAGIDPAVHRGITSADDSDFRAIRAHLREARERHHVETDLYTLRRVEGGTEFVVMTNPTPFYGHLYEPTQEVLDAFASGDVATTDVYETSRGKWISAHAPIGADTVLCVDRRAEDLLAHRRGRLLWALILGCFGSVVAIVAPRLASARGGPVAGLRRLLTGSLATRIGMVGSLAVVLAVGIVGTLDHRAAKNEAVRSTSAQLLTVVKVGVTRLPVDEHLAIVEAGTHESAHFEQVRDELRAIREAAGLDTDMYTLRRDKEITRFVAMTNETPYVGDPYELRPGVQHTFETGEAGAEGPYTDAHGTWISAWAPMTDADGRVVAILQADQRVGDLLRDLYNRTLRRVLFALVGCLVAFLGAAWAARSVARPVAQIAEAARQIELGNLDVRVPEDRIDEVGAMANAINQMALGLQERRRIRDAFGKYIAAEVVTQLIDTGSLSMAGELREITIVESDIRGYTPLAESLGAEEIVCLLNEYFSILVEEVVREGGHIDKFMGDAMLCWFGAPFPAADHRARAVRAATRIMERLAAWNADRVAAGLPEVHTGMGVASGDVVVGNIGSPDHKIEYTAIGDAVNLSARLCSAAKSGEILVSEQVYEGASDARLQPVGPMKVKGVREPVQVYKKGPIAPTTG